VRLGRSKPNEGDQVVVPKAIALVERSECRHLPWLPARGFRRLNGKRRGRSRSAYGVQRGSVQKRFLPARDDPFASEFAFTHARSRPGLFGLQLSSPNLRETNATPSPDSQLGLPIS
jgi:hypothetical protein